MLYVAISLVRRGAGTTQQLGKKIRIRMTWIQILALPLINVCIQASYLTSLPRKIHCYTDGTVLSRCQFWGYIYAATLCQVCREGQYLGQLPLTASAPSSASPLPQWSERLSSFYLPQKLPWKRGRETALLKDLLSEFLSKRVIHIKILKWSRTL